MTDLKPCPFCGSNETDPINGDRCWIACLTCWAEGPSADTPEDAAERWNNRSVPEGYYLVKREIIKATR